MSSYTGHHAPLTIPTALIPANDSELIQPKPVPNPVLASQLHKALNSEIKVKSKAGTLIEEKSELEKIFHSRKTKSVQKPVPDNRTPIECELGSRLQGMRSVSLSSRAVSERRQRLDSLEKPPSEAPAPSADENVPEFMKIKLRKA